MSKKVRFLSDEQVIEQGKVVEEYVTGEVVQFKDDRSAAHWLRRGKAEEVSASTKVGKPPKATKPASDSETDNEDDSGADSDSKE